MEQQDQTLTSISGTLHTLAEQAGLMGQEILEHNECVIHFDEPHPKGNKACSTI